MEKIADGSFVLRFTSVSCVVLIVNNKIKTQD